MAVLIPQESLGKKEPVRRWWLWGYWSCPRCKNKLQIHWDEPITLTLDGAFKKRMSYVTYKCPNNDYHFAEYEDNYEGYDIL